MNIRTYLLVSGTIFGLVALAHLVRIVNGWSLDVGGWSAPMLVSWIGFGVTAVLAVYAFRLARGQS